MMETSKGLVQKKNNSGSLPNKSEKINERKDVSESRNAGRSIINFIFSVISRQHDNGCIIAVI